MRKIRETLNRPTYVGMRTLDLNQTLMYDNDKAQLLSTDTDSLTFEIETKDVYKDFWNSKDRFDNSEYPEDLKQFDKTNKKGIGKFKDEAARVPLLN